MTDLAPCPACQRHVRIDETACPFCAAALAPGEPRVLGRGRLARAAVFAGAALATTAGAAGCGGKAKPADTNVENAAVDAGADEQPAPPDAAPYVEPDYPDEIEAMPYGAPPARHRLV